MDTLEANHQVAVSVMLLICQHSNTFVPALIKGSNWTLIGLSAPGRVREQPLHRRPPLFLRARAAAAPRMGRAGAGPGAPTGRAEGSGERRMRSGAESRGAGERAPLCQPEPGREARSGSVRRNPAVSWGAGRGGRGSCPRAERPRAAGGGCWRRGRQSARGRPCDWRQRRGGVSPDRSLSLPRRVSSRGRPGLPLPSALPAFPPAGPLPSIGPGKAAAAAAAQSEGSSHMNQFLSVSGSGQRRRL